MSENVATMLARKICPSSASSSRERMIVGIEDAFFCDSDESDPKVFQDVSYSSTALLMLSPIEDAYGGFSSAIPGRPSIVTASWHGVDEVGYPYPCGCCPGAYEFYSSSGLSAITTDTAALAEYFSSSGSSSSRYTGGSVVRVADYGSGMPVHGPVIVDVDIDESGNELDILSVDLDQVGVGNAVYVWDGNDLVLALRGQDGGTEEKFWAVYFVQDAEWAHCTNVYGASVRLDGILAGLKMAGVSLADAVDGVL